MALDGKGVPSNKQWVELQLSDGENKLELFKDNTQVI